jgi:hypothetical protein
MTATQLALATAEPVDLHAEARRIVRDTIAAVADIHGGVVSANTVRRLLDEHRQWGADIPPRLVGQVYAALRREGRLIEVGVERSDDVKGSNAGRLQPLYRWVEVAS